MTKLLANSGDLDQMPHSAAYDLGLHCLPITHLGVSRLKWDNRLSHYILLYNSILLDLHCLYEMFLQNTIFTLNIPTP